MLAIYIVINEITQAGRAEGVGTTWGITEVPSIGRLHVREDVWGAFVMILVKLSQLSEKMPGTDIHDKWIYYDAYDGCSIMLLFNELHSDARACSFTGCTERSPQCTFGLTTCPFE